MVEINSENNSRTMSKTPPISKTAGMARSPSVGVELSPARVTSRPNSRSSRKGGVNHNNKRDKLEGPTRHGSSETAVATTVGATTETIAEAENSVRLRRYSSSSSCASMERAEALGIRSPAAGGGGDTHRR